MNLALADLLILLVCLPTALIELYTSPNTWVLGPVMCEYPSNTLVLGPVMCEYAIYTWIFGPVTCEYAVNPPKHLGFWPCYV